MFANKITTEYTYDEEQNLAKVITRDKTGRELLAYQYRYDNNGNRLRKKERGLRHSYTLMRTTSMET